MTESLTINQPYWFLKYLFDKNDIPEGMDLKMLKLDSTSLYSITPHRLATELCNIIKFHMRKFNMEKITITDACACVGGDSINFCKTFDKVNTIEICRDRYEFLLHNLFMFGFTNFKAYNKDCLELIPRLKQDVIYFDLPWGGMDYKNLIECPLMLGDKHIYDICNEYKMYCKILILKVPNNFYYKIFRSKIDTDKCFIYDLKKFRILVMY